MTSQQTVNRGRIRLEPSPKRVRVQLGGLTVADSSRAVLVWEKPYYPTYYFPMDDVRTDLLVPDPGVSHSPSRGDGTPYTVTAGPRTVPGAAVRYEQSPIPQLRDLVRFDWDAMDHWFEEDEEVYTHPRDPYTRVDILASSRRVQVEVDGVTVADSTSPRLLFETGLPTRYYLPKTDVRMDLLGHTDTSTGCPYKGNRGVLVDRRQRPRAPRYRMVVQGAIRGEPEDRRPDRVLQREGGPRRRRPASRPSADEVQLSAQIRRTADPQVHSRHA